MALDLGHDFLGNRPLIQGVRTFLGNALEDLGQGRVLQQGTDGFRAAIAVEEIPGHVGGARQERIGGNHRVQAWRDRKALLRQRDGRLEQPGPWQAPVFAMRHLQCAQDPRRADRTATDLCLRERHRLAIGLQEQPFGGARRCGFAAIVGAHGLAVPQHDHGATANSRRLGFYQGQHRLHGDGGVDG